MLKLSRGFRCPVNCSPTNVGFMQSRVLGKGSLVSSTLAYGCWRLAGSEGSESRSAEQRRHGIRAVLAAARQLFSESGYEGATIRDIAAAAGMSTGAVFANFTDKYEVEVAADAEGVEIADQLFNLLIRELIDLAHQEQSRARVANGAQRLLLALDAASRPPARRRSPPPPPPAGATRSCRGRRGAQWPCQAGR